MKGSPVYKKNTYKQRLEMKLRPRQTILQKMVFIYSTVLLLMLGISILFYFQFGKVEKARAAASGDYRSVVTGNWGSTGTWEKYNGTSWAAAIATPTSTDGVIEIQSGDTVTVAASVTADQVIVDAGGSLTVSATKVLTIANGTGTDLTNNGKMTISGTLTESASTSTVVSGTTVLANAGSNTFGGSSTITINSGGRYKEQDATFTATSGIWTVNSGGVFQCDVEAGVLPLATWNTGSTCEVTGVIATQPTNLAQSFNNFTWNCSSQTSKETLAGLLTTINGDFNFISTGTGSVLLASAVSTLTVGGNYNHQGGTLFINTTKIGTVTVTGNYVQTGGYFYYGDSTSGGGDGRSVMNVTGDFSLSGGTYNVSSITTTALNDGVTALNLSGNFTQTGGNFTETSITSATYGYGNIYFNDAGTQTFTRTGGSFTGTINLTVNSGSVLDAGTSTVVGGGAFTLLSGGGLMMSDPNGITTSGASGNIQVTGTRSYNTGADYTYYGSAAQNTGNGLPATVHNFTLNNSGGVTLTNSASISNALTFTSGNLTTSSDTLTLGTSTAVLGTLSRTSGYVVGYLRRWIAASTTSNILFPVGTSTDYKGANFSYTTAPTTGGTITANFIPAVLTTGGSNFYDSPDSVQVLGNGYWNTTAGNSLAGGAFSLDLTATNLFGVTNYNKLHLVRRNNSGSSWGTQGTYVTATGSNAIPLPHRTGITSLGQFGIGSPLVSNVLPIHLIYFNAKLNGERVDLSWATATELNNDHFTVERSSEGTRFNKILEKPGAGNSTVTRYYSDVDKNPLSGYSYYRLKQTDYDGHFTYSDIKTVKNKSGPGEELQLEVSSIAPNPFSEGFKIAFTLKTAGVVNFQLINSSGQVVVKDVIQAGEGMNHYEFTDQRNLDKGLYFVNLIYNEAAITKKVIKQ